MRLTGKFSVACGGGLHHVEIREGCIASSVDDHHDFDLERSLVEMGGEPSDCMRFVLEHENVVTGALEEMLFDLFLMVFTKQPALDVREEMDAQLGVELPQSAFAYDMEITSYVLEKLSVSGGQLEAIRDAMKRCDKITTPKTVGDICIIGMAGEVSMVGMPEFEGVLPAEAEVVTVGSGHVPVSVGVDSKWVEHGVVDEDALLGDVDSDELHDTMAVVDAYYKWAVYTRCGKFIPGIT